MLPSTRYDFQYFVPFSDVRPEEEPLWLRSAEQKRLNGFHARCLRKVLGIPHPYISRVSNDEVLRQAGEKPLFHELLRRQMLLYGKVVRMPGTCLQRQVALKPGSAEPAVWHGKLRRGRPRQAWTTHVFGHLLQALGEGADGDTLAAATGGEWENKVSTYISSMEEAEVSEETTSRSAHEQTPF